MSNRYQRPMPRLWTNESGPGILQCDATTGHVFRNIAFCESVELASLLVCAWNNFTPLRIALRTLLDNPHDKQAQICAAKVLADLGAEGETL